MKIAVISDIHGNMQALEAVLADIKKENCDRIFCLGDLAMAGPQPAETLEKMENMIRNGEIVSIQGNTDEMIFSYTPAQVEQLKDLNKIMGHALENDKELISEPMKKFLKSLPSTKEIELDGIKIFLSHGSPRKNNENIMPDTPLNQLEEMISGTKADVIFVGHTHIPCGFQTNTNQTVVNVGSVGRPFTPNAQSAYAILETNSDKTYEVKHKFVRYDNKKAAEILSKRTFFESYKLADMLIKPTERYPK